MVVHLVIRKLLLVAACALFCAQGVLFGENAPAAKEVSGCSTDQDVPALTFNQAVERQINGGQTHAYRIELDSGQYVHLVVDQRGIDVLVALCSPDGKELTTSDSLNGAFGPEPLSFIATDAGTYRIEIRVPDEVAPRGSYSARITSLRQPTTSDKARVTAEREFMQAVQLLQSRSQQSQQHAVEVFLQLLPVWETLGDMYQKAADLSAVGSAYRALEHPEDALKYYNTALSLWRQIGDRSGEATTLTDIAWVYGDVGDKKKALDYYEQALPLHHAVGDRRLEAVALTGIGSLYHDAGDNHKALEYLTQALPLRREVRDRAGEAITVKQIAGAYQDAGDKQKALEYYNQLLGLQRALGDRPEQAYALYYIGVLYYDLANKQKALEFYARALALSQDARDRYGEAVALNAIGGVYSDLGEEQKALDYYQEALSLRRALRNPSAEAITLHNIGLVYEKLEENQKALEYFKQALPLRRAVGDHLGEARTLHSLGAMYRILGDEENALDCYMHELPLRRSIGDRSGEAQTLNDIGTAYQFLSDHQKALPYLQEALLLWRALGDRSGEAMTENNVGEVFRSSGDGTSALESFNRALSLSKSVGNRNVEARSLNNIAAVLRDRGENQQAVPYIEQALRLLRLLGDRAAEATVLHNLAAVYSDLGKKQTALEYYSQALPLEHSTGYRYAEAHTLSNMGSIYEYLGDQQKALESYKQALLLRRAVGDRSGEAATLNNIGMIYHERGDNQEALGYFNETLRLSRAMGARAIEASALNNLGAAYRDLQQMQNALDYYQQAQSLSETIHDSSTQSSALHNIAEVYSRSGQRQKSFEYYVRALALSKAAGDREGEAITFGNLMGLARSDDPQLAILFGKQSVNALQELRRNISGLSKELQRSFAKSKEAYYRELAAVLIYSGRFYEAQHVMDLLKDEEYFDFIRRGEAVTRTGPVALIPLDAKPLVALEAEASGLAAKETLTAAEQQRKDYLDAQLKAAKLAAGEFFDQTGRVRAPADEQIAKAAARDEQLEAKGLQKDLDANTVAIYTVVADDSFHSLLITPKLMKPWSYQITKQDLRKKVFAFREALRDPDQDPLPLARELYRIIVGDLDKELTAANTTTILWSLDDVLRYIPMAALNDGHQYLAERFRAVVYSKASSRSGGEFRQWRALAAGVSESHFGLPALENVPKELSGIVHNGSNTTGVMPGTEILNEAFTPAALRAALHRDYPVVHIASHFVFNPGNDNASFLLLGNEQKLSLADLREKDDYTFNGVQLLTLSACDTAAGAAADGREIDGLGFLAEEKGAHAIMATLWEVADESTGEFMQRFYRELSSPGVTKAEALQRAELALLHGDIKPASQSTSGFTHPYYWAPFILIGNGR